MTTPYRAAGVDVEAGDRFVDSIKALAATTSRPGADAKLGGFGALFDVKEAGLTDPILVAATDGVGTKVKLAAETGQHRPVGIDLVAMCVNDLVVQGAEPMFFLDYMASGKLEPTVAHDLVAGIADGCRQAGCALIGGETAEMPGVYALGDYDLAGFAVGAAERATLLDGTRISVGDCVIGLASDGVHANGFSLVRQILAGDAVPLHTAPPFTSTASSLIAALMQPTRIYVRACLAAHRAGLITGFAHVTAAVWSPIPIACYRPAGRSLSTARAGHLPRSSVGLPPAPTWIRSIWRVRSTAVSGCWPMWHRIGSTRPAPCFAIMENDPSRSV